MPRSGCIWHIVSLWGCSKWRCRWGRGAGLRQYRPGGSCPRYLRRSRCSCFCKNNNVNLSRCEQQKPSRAEYCTKCVERLKSWMVSLKVMQYMPRVMSHLSWAELKSDMLLISWGLQDWIYLKLKKREGWLEFVKSFLDFNFIKVLCAVYSALTKHTLPLQFQHKV